MKVAVQALSHATFDTPDIDRMVDYYVDILNLQLGARERDRAFLYTATGLPAVVLNKGSVSRCTGIAFEVDPDADFDAAADALQQEFQLPSERRQDSLPGVADLLSFDDMNGLAVSLVAGTHRLGSDGRGRDFTPLRLAHIAFKTPELHPSVRLYEDVLGLKVSDWRADFFVWLRCGPEHHVIDFIRNDVVKMHHVAFELRDATEIMRACDSLGRKKHKLIYGPGRHLIADNIFTYHRNPDGQIIELYTEMAKIESEAVGAYTPRPWHTHQPYKPRVWDADTPGNLWGPGAPPGFADG